MRFGFIGKCAVALALVILVDRLAADEIAGVGFGVFAGAWALGLVLARPDVRRRRSAWIALAAAAVFVTALVDDPGPLALLLFWCALSIAALLPRTARFDDAWHWAARLALHGMSSITAPIHDLARILRRRRTARSSPAALAATLALPLAGGALFLFLFARANPLIETSLTHLRLPSIGHALLWSVVALAAWPSLRPHRATILWPRLLPDPEPRLPGTSLPSVLIALALFNAIFAVQNLLDILFLWSGETLPAGVTQADYAHRGAYPLIVTALIAGVMALAMLRPGSASAAHPLARRLVTLWVVQNIVLVASSALRTHDYIGVSMLTEWRIAALLWMALVATGLVLVGWRILRGRSARWLVNGNALAAALVLIPCTLVDLGAIAARANVQAKAPARIDLCYLRRVGDGALLPLIALERRPMDLVTRDRVRAVRSVLLLDLSARQNSWSEWTPRGARRLAQARAQLGTAPPQPAALTPLESRGCDGAIRRPAPYATRS